MSEIKIEKVQKLEINEGDILIVKVDMDNLSADDMLNLDSNVKMKFEEFGIPPDKVRIIIADNKIDFQVLRNNDT